VTLSVSATGTAPLSYQWFRNQFAVATGTNSALVLTNGSVLNAGNYFVVVSNSAGAATSQVARVTVDEALTFRILALRTNGFVALEVNSIAGDDRGGMAVSANSVFLNGDGATAHWRKSDLAVAGRASQRFDALISDLRTEKAYTLGNGDTPLTAPGDVTSLIELDDNGNFTGNQINLSATITLDTASIGFFAGYGRVILTDNGVAYNVDIPSGIVTVLTTSIDVNFHTFSENFVFDGGFWGVAEYSGGELSVLYAQNSSSIVRTRVRDNVTSEVANFAPQGISDLASFTFSPSLSRWFFHYQGTGIFGSRDETLGWAKALFTTDPNFPEIVGQPQGTTVYAGTPINITVTATGSGIAYQWRVNGANIAGATNATLVLDNPQESDSGRYTVEVSNLAGNVVSGPAIVTVLPLTPVIHGQPRDQVAILGGTVSFSVFADGPQPLSYQWTFNGGNISGATNNSLLFTNVQASDPGTYSVSVSNRFGGLVSSNVQLRLITPLPENASFRVVSIKSTNARIVDDANVINYELGGIALTLNKIFYQGGIGTASFEQDLSNGALIHRNYNSLLCDIRTGRTFVLATNDVPLDSNIGLATHLLELDALGQPLGRKIPLSSAIPFPRNFNQDVGFFSGYGQAVIFNTTNFYNISLPSGTVVNLGLATNSIQHNFSQNWAYWGIAENVSGTNYILYAQNYNTIARTRVPDGLTTSVASFNFFGQMGAICAAPYLNRWYFHYPYNSTQFGGTNDTLGYADAVYEIKQADHYEFAPIGSPQVINQPIPVTLFAKDANNNVVTNFQGTVNLAGNAAGSVVPISPTVVSNFVNGVWNGLVTVSQSSTSMVLVASDLTGSAGTSAPFPVIPGNDLFVTAATTPASGTVGQPLTYTLMVSNTGPAVAHGVVLSNYLPANIVLQSVTPSTGSCANNGGVIRCDLADLGSGAAFITIQVTTPTLGLLTNITTVSRTDADASALDDSVTLVTTVNFPASSADDVSIVEGNTGTNTVAMNVHLSAPSTNTVSVSYSMFNGTAVANVDFVLKSGTLTFPPGSTNQVILLGIRGETLYEANEVFSVSFSSPVNAIIGKNSATCTIINDDATPVISIGNATVVEGNSTTNVAKFEVRMSARTGVQIQVAYYTTNGTAEAGRDFAPVSGVVTFTANTFTQTQFITVPIVGDTIAESNEVFYVYLAGVSNAASGNLIGTGTILNDDGIGVLDHFTLSPVSSPQIMGAAVPITITAKDFFQTTISNFNGTVSLGASVGLIEPTNTVLGEVVPSFNSSGDYTLGYSFIPSRDITVSSVRHYFGTKISFWTDNGTLLLSQPVTNTGPQWSETALATPLTLLGGNIYRSAAYTGNSNYYYMFGLPAEFADGSIIGSYNGSGDVFPNNSDGVRWWFVDFSYGIGPFITLPTNPTNSANFTNGVWTGSIAVLGASTNVNFRVFDAAGHPGFSQAFDVLPFSIQAIHASGGDVHVQALGLPNRTYELLRSETIANPIWNVVATVDSNASGAVELIQTGGVAAPSGFYKVHLVP